MDKTMAETSRLDIGCGAVPTGDVNLDLLIPGDERRQFDPQKIKNFILADCQHLPFPDNTFLEVYSSHFLEHVRDPDRMPGGNAAGGPGSGVRDRALPCLHDLL